jgi:histidinol-phosphate aminotransferase
LREAGVQLRDARSFGLPDHVRLAVLPPASQAALASAWHAAKP